MMVCSRLQKSTKINKNTNTHNRYEQRFKWDWFDSKKKLTGIAALPSPKTKEEFMCVWPAL